MVERGSKTVLGENDSIGFPRDFHVEVLRGGMNRLLLRSRPTETDPERIEVFFQYVQRLEVPMHFTDLTIEDSTLEDGVSDPWAATLEDYSECRIWRLRSQGHVTGRIAAAACVVGRDHASNGSPSMFFMMD